MIARRRHVSTALMVLLLAASPAAAVPFSITDVDGAFLNAVPAVAIGGNPNNVTARWGDPATLGGQSGYNFDAVVPPQLDGAVPPSPTAWFHLANFTHLNKPIFGTTLSSIGLNVTLDFAIGAVSFPDRTFLYTLTHNETPNAFPCPAFQQSPCCVRR